MTAADYIKKLEEICNREFIPAIQLTRELDIAHNTLLRAKRNPEISTFKTMQKIKAFVDKWEAKNMSGSD